MRVKMGSQAGDGAIRCAYVGTNAVLDEFTLTNGHTRTDGDYDEEMSGGGVWCEASGVVSNCTLTGNSAGDDGGGALDGTLNNCIVYYNTAPNGPNYYDNFGSTFIYSCTTPLPVGLGNITDEPWFMDTNGWSNLRLQSNSPCINAGNNAYVTTSTDLDGNPRIVGGTVDMGRRSAMGWKRAPSGAAATD